MNSNKANSLWKILVIGEKADLVHFLHSQLQHDFTVSWASNGQQGVELVLKFMPDLIISNTITSEMDGYELTKLLKNDIRTWHIPIILFTPKANFESKILSYQSGADHYLPIPFNIIELVTVIQNLIENREKLKTKFKTLSILYNQSEIIPLDSDEIFLKNLMEVMNKKYSEDSFGTDQLTREMRMSRVQLYRKLKALTGLSVSHFIRLYRLTLAREKIEKSLLSISEIAYESGFKDPAYFTHAFNNEYGISPSKIREKSQKIETYRQVHNI